MTSITIETAIGATQATGRLSESEMITKARRAAECYAQAANLTGLILTKIEERPGSLAVTFEAVEN